MTIQPSESTLGKGKAGGASVDKTRGNPARHPVAIVGMACKFPGAPDVTALWNLLKKGGNAITEGVPGSGVGRIGRFYPHSAAQYDACRFAALMEDVDLFDAEFFRISPVEAQLLDPQQRIALETCWQALEDAGIDPDSLKGTRTGVYIGISNNDYRHLSLASAPQISEPAASLYTVSGTSFNTVAGRVAFSLDLEGPTMVLDTACSSSLVAVHNAVSVLQQDQADLMLVGGVQAIFNGLLTQLRAQAGMLSPDGQCKAFDASANGFVRGEGCGVVVLKRLVDAQADDDPIWGIVLGSAVNQDGATSGMTVPSEPAQVRVIEEALGQAGIAPPEVDYLEAHGTGTQVGDPLELNAAARAYGPGRDPARPLLIGSVKTNLGHLEPTAGMAGLIKVLLSMQHGLIPKHLHFHNPTPLVDWDNLPLQVTAEMTDWPLDPPRPPRAGVSSYGWSGTNAHLLVEGYGSRLNPDPGPSGRQILRPSGAARVVIGALPEPSDSTGRVEGAPQGRPARLLPLSGKSDASLQDLAKSYISWLDTTEGGPRANGAESLADLAWSAAVGRSHFDHRAAVVFRDLSSLKIGLEGVAERGGAARLPHSPLIAFVYTGQGGQWKGMGEDLYQTEPVARTVLERCDALIQRERGSSLLDVIFGRPAATGDLDDPAWTQPAIYAVECALTELWASLGIRPDVVLGHSLGEIAAAYASGVYSLEEGLRFASVRGTLMGSLPRAGAMAAVFASAEQTARAAAEWNEAYPGADLCIGVDNGTHQVISGARDNVIALTDRMEREGTRVIRLPPSPAYHSPLVEPVLNQLEGFFEGLTISAPRKTLVSSMTGRPFEPGSLPDGAYWREQSRRPVAFRKSVKALSDLGVEVVVELGPHAILGPLVSLNWPDGAESPGSPVVLSSLLRPRSERSAPERADAFPRAVAKAYETGLAVSLRGLFLGEERRRVSLPGYPFQRRRHWVSAPKKTRTADAHQLLGVRHDSPRGDVTFEIEMFPSDPAWLSDHEVFGRVILPGAMYGAMAATVPLLEGGTGAVVEDLQLHRAVVFRASDSDGEPSESGCRLQILVDDADPSQFRRFEIFSQQEGEEAWTRHATGLLSASVSRAAPRQVVDLNALKGRILQQDPSAYYRAKAAAGVEFGPSFRALENLWSVTGEALGEVVLRATGEDVAQTVHPLLLDGCLQVLSAARDQSGIGVGITYLPFGWERLRLDRPLPERLFCHARIREPEDDEVPQSSQVPETLTGDLWFYDPRGRALGSLSGLILKRATRASLLAASEGVQDLLYEVLWRELPLIDGARSAQALESPTTIALGIDTFAEYLSHEGVEIAERAALMGDLERLSRSYALAALERLGWKRQSGETIRVADLGDGLQIVPEHSRLLRRMLRLLVDAGVLARSPDGGYRVEVGFGDTLPDEALYDAEAFSERTEAIHPHGANELGMLRRSGGALDQVLRGTVDPLSIMFRSEGPGATEFYFTAPASRASNRLLGDAVASLVAEWPSDRRLRIIEVGAGTGSGTSVVLPELPDGRFDYLYTDISAGFFAEAEKRFSQNGAALEYRPLDIERDPVTQGYSPHSYDLVIAVNVLHATRDLGETLSNCLRLLAPSGVLVAVESLRGRGWQDMTFGQLDGWWRYSDSYRPNHALASPGVWLQALSDRGFVDSVVLGGESQDSQGPLGSGVILARGPEKVEWPGGVWVLAAGEGSAGEKLALELTDLNQTVILAEEAPEGDLRPDGPGVLGVAVAPDQRESWRLLLENLPKDTPLRGVVHCAAVEGHGPDATVEELAEDTRRICGGALALMQGLLDSGIIPTDGVWFVTRGALALARDYLRETVGALAGATVWGLGKAVAREAGHLAPKMIDLDPDDTEEINHLADELLFWDDETHIAYREGRRFGARLIREKANTNRIALPDQPGWRLAPGEEGLEGLRVDEAVHRHLEPGEVRVAVEAAGLNLSDVLIGLGVVRMDPQLGDEFCGRITETGPEVNGFEIGDRVVGLAIGSFRPEVVTRAEMTAHAPAGIPLTALATVPTAFVTVELAFAETGLEAGDRVLIHAASGGVGLAAVQLAQAAGAEVFATASGAKQDYLRAQGITRVFNSRTTDYGREILDVTDGAGVSVVLNSLTGPGYIEASLACLESGGRFVELGRRDIWSSEQMADVRPDVSYFILKVDHLKRHDPVKAGASLQRVLKRLSTGELAPLAHTKWPMAEVRSAMEFMRSARHIGKNVIVMPPLIHGQLRSDRSYLVTGGLGGIGGVVAGWLAEQGAGVVVLNGRRPPDPEAEAGIEALRRSGADIRIELADVRDAGAIDAMLARIDVNMPPLGGIIHSVGVLSDGSLGNQNWERFQRVLWPKVLGGWHLHQASLHRDLDLFVVFSSVTGVLGNSGQGNHAAANAFLDQLAGYRRSLGLAGQSIAWGAWSGLGEAEEQRERIERQLAASGTGWITPRQGIRAFDRLVRQDHTSAMVATVEWPAFAENFESPPPLLRELLAETDDRRDSEDADRDRPLRSRLQEKPASEWEDLLVEYLKMQVQAVLRLPSVPAASVGFFDLGMDSLMSVELRNRLNRACSGEYVVSNTAVFDYPTVADLAHHLAEELSDAVQADQNPVTAEASPAPMVEELPPADSNDIAVIGMACRFPQAVGLAAFWDLLDGGEDAVTDGRPDPGNWTGVVGNPDASDIAHRRGAFVEGIEWFDSRFFHISPIEAQLMDPQQRMLLETSWHALEDAGMDPSDLKGSRGGVYVGIGGSEYRDVVQASRADSYLGTTASVAAGRIAFALGLEGPAMPIDMACASSLAAVHQAVASLQRGEVDLALAGGVNVVLSTAVSRFMMDVGMLSPSGHCRPFDASADGYVRGEGCGMVILKRLGQAEADGDRIWAVIRGSAINQNGASAGLTVPNGPAQERVMREALAQAGVSPLQVDYLEAHATGSQLGDPIELNAAAAVYGAGRDPEHPLLIGSVKSNIGHAEWAAGIAAFIKVVLALSKESIPKNPHFEVSNPNVDWDRVPVRIVSEKTPWPSGVGRRPWAGVSAFGLSGANVHVLVEGCQPSSDAAVEIPALWPAGDPQAVPVTLPEYLEGESSSPAEPTRRRVRLLPLSGKSAGALRALAERYLLWLDAVGGGDCETTLADMAWTAGVGRSHHPYRTGVAFRDARDLASRLRLVADHFEYSDDEIPETATRVAFVYAGQFGSGAGMGGGLYRSEPVVRAVLDRCDDLMQQEQGISLLEVLFGRRDRRSDPQDSSPTHAAVYAFGCAMAELWASVGIRPAVVLGHGPGAVAAAQGAGVISLEEGLRLSAALGGLPGFQSDQGGLEKLKGILAAIARQAPSVPLVCRATGGVIESGDEFGLSHLIRNCGDLLDSSGCSKALAELGVDAIVELWTGSDPAGRLGDAGPNARRKPALLFSPASPSSDLSESSNAIDGFVETVIGAYRAGLDINFRGLFAGERRRRISLPGYPFQRRRHWV